MGANIRLSVILLTYNSAGDVTPCIDPLLESLPSEETEIIVIDNGSVDQTLSILQSYGSAIRLFPQSRNLGVAAGRNIGLSKSSGRYILILDIDTIPNKEAIEQMLAYLEADAGCGVCACKLTSAAGDVQDSCRRMPYIRYKLLNILSARCKRFGRLSSWLTELNEGQFYHSALGSDKPFDAEYVIGACQMIPARVIKEAGLLDENIFYGPEDADFCKRVSSKGYSVRCLPAVSIIHHYNRVTTKKLFSRMTWMHMRGLLYFYAKHRMW